MFSLSPLTQFSPNYPTGASGFEVALQNIPSLQEELGRKELQKLARISSTCKAVADDIFLWKRQINVSLGIKNPALGLLTTSSFAVETGRSINTYKRIVRGINLIDGLKCCKVPQGRETKEQSVCIGEAKEFLQARVPGFSEAISSRHAAYGTAFGEEEFTAIAVLATAALGLVSATAINKDVLLFFHGLAGFNYEQTRSLPNFSPLFCFQRFEYSKLSFFCSSTYLTIESFLFFLVCASETNRLFFQLQHTWRARQSSIAAAILQQHIAVLRAIDAESTNRPIPPSPEVRPTVP